MGKNRLELKTNWLGYGLVVVLIHILGVGCLLFAMKEHPSVLGLGILAYTLGLRHAFDADHIAAIDNTVRKLLQQKEDPVGVGFFFSLGHSSIVYLMTFFTVFATKWTLNNIPKWKEIGGIVATSVSGGFLLLIGLINLFVLLDIFKVFLQMRNDTYDQNKLEELLYSRGFLARLITPLLEFVKKSWHIYPIGFLFGLGFDTSSEVSLLAISAGAGNSDMSFMGIIALPTLFAAGMSLLDTADGVFMTTAYQWAFSTPLRRVYYNLTVTGLAVIAALTIGFIELIQVLGAQLGYSHGILGWVQTLNLGSIGYILVILFILTWIISYGTWRVFHIEERWSK